MTARLRKFLRWATVGAATLGVYLAAGHVLGLQHAASFWVASVPFAAAVALNYALQRWWVFEDARPVSASLPRYAAMVGLGFAINFLAVRHSPFTALVLTQLYAATLVVGSNAVLSFTWVFGQRARQLVP